MIREEVEKVKAAGDWHVDEIYLFERLSMRSYEEVISSEWRIDLPTLPEGLFTTDPEKIFIKNNCNSSYSGTFCSVNLPSSVNQLVQVLRLSSASLYSDIAFETCCAILDDDLRF